MKRFFTLAICVCSFLVADAQQIPLFTQYRENLGLINPAAVNGQYLVYEQNFTAGLSYRSQWTELSGAPRTAVIHGEYLTTDFEPVNALFGGYAINDQTGPTGFSGVYGRIAGLFSGDPYYGGVSVGLTVGLVQYRVKASELIVREEGDILTQENQSKLFPDVGIGVFAYTRLNGGMFDDDQVYGGVSMPQAMGLDLEFKDETGSFSTKRIQHFYGVLGMYKYLYEGSYLEPSVWVKYVEGAPVNVDFNLRYQMVFNFWLGAGISTAKNFHLETGFVLGEDDGLGSNLRIGYGFDHSFSTFGPFAGSTHEINIAYSFGD